MGNFSRNSVADHNVLPVTWYFKCKRKPGWTISRFKAQYCVRGGFHKRLSSETLNLYSPVVQWLTVMLMFILQCILGLQSQIIDFRKGFAQTNIPIVGPVFIVLTSHFKGDGGEFDVVIRLNKSYMINMKPHAYGMKSYEIDC